MSLNTATGSAGAAPMPIETDDVTIVVATRNRPDRLAETVSHHRLR
jgi:hypothetical protein